MFEALQRKGTLMRILLGVFLAPICIGMLLYLIPGQGTSTASATDIVAEVSGQPITVNEVHQQLQRITSRGGQIPRALAPLYAQQVLNQLVFERMLEAEAKRLGIRVTDDERAERIKLLLPTAYNGETFVGMERYAADVQSHFQMGVPEFEELVRQGLLEEKFRHLVTDGISVSPEEVQQEFRRRNEKVKVEYAVIQPDTLESQVPASEADLNSYFEKNKSRYVVPERRLVRYALLDREQLRSHLNVTDAELRAYYNEHIERYKIENRVHAQHILFKTVGKTDAEIEEIRKKAQEVLNKARHGAKFEDLAKQYSEDGTKDKGGDLGWIVPGQTVTEFERTAFSIPKGSISDLVRTQYGFHIIKVLDHETPRTQSFEEVRASIWPAVAADKAERMANDQANEISAEVRRSSRGSLDDLAKKFQMTLGQAGPLSANDPVPDLGNAPELRDAIFRQRAGDLGQPVRTEKGYVVLSVKEVLPSHPATFEEVRDKVAAEYKREKAVELAKTRTEELAKRAQGGEVFQAAAKAMGFEAKTSEAFSRTGSVPGVGSAHQLSAAFTTPVGHTAAPVFLGSNWVVFRIAEHQDASTEEFAKQRASLEQQVLQSKRQLAYESFKSALEERMKREGKLTYNQENLKRLTSLS